MYSHFLSWLGATEIGGFTVTLSLTTNAAADLRAQIPALHRQVNGLTPVYLDAPGGTQMPQPVIDAMLNYMVGGMANRRGTSATSLETESIVERARVGAAALVGASDHVIIFGQNMTSLSIALAGAMARDWQPSDRNRVVVSEIDHHANVDPWLGVAQDREMAVEWLPVIADELRTDLSNLDDIVDERARVVTMSLASNVVGTINDVASICARARDVGAISVVDAVHGAPHVPMNVDAWGADVLFFSAHKFFGPHLGVMAIRRELLERLRFYKVAAAQGSEYLAETGTQNHEGIAGLAAVFDLLQSLAPGATLRDRLTGAVEELGRYDDILADRLVEGLGTVNTVRLRRAPDHLPKTATVAFTVKGRHPKDVGAACASRSVFVTDGEVYSNTLAKRTSVAARGGWVRAGVAPYLDITDIDRGIEAIEFAARRGD